MSIPFNAKKATCPGCGAQLIFKTGSGRLVICDFCGYAVADSSTGIENIGKVADLIPTGAKLTLGARGTFENRPFQIIGREQMRWEQGVWDEWYIAFDDGRWGWLAEDDGEYMVSVRVHNRLTPRRHSLRVGQSFQLGEDGRFTVTEIRTATWVSGRGELPETVRPGDSYDYVDLSGQNGKYATLDFSNGDVPVIYIGRKVTLEELGITTDETAGDEAEAGLVPMGGDDSRTSAEAMVCPECKAPLSLQVPDLAKQVTCDHCGALLSVEGSRLAFLKKLPHGKPARFLGKKCTFFGTEYLTIGWMRRGGKDSDGLHFSWEEYLLYDAKSTNYRFLCVEDNHWSFSTPIAAGDVEVMGVSTVLAMYKDGTYRKFADDMAAVEAVQGEFFWRATVGDTCRCCDYISPPQGLSSEEDKHEISWSHEVHLEGSDVLAAYGDTEPLQEPDGVGPLQPSPSKSLKWKCVLLAIVFAVAAYELTRMFDKMAPNEQLIHAQLPMKAWTPMDTPPVQDGTPSAAMPPAEIPSAVDVLDQMAFEIQDDINYNLELNIRTNVDNGWAALDIALINETTSEIFDLGAHEISYYHGYEGGESWSEGSKTASATLGSLPAGRYVMRVDSVWGSGDDSFVSDPWTAKTSAGSSPSVTVELKRGTVSYVYMILFWVFLLPFPLIFFIADSYFETSRWSDSDFGPSGDDDDDDDD